MDLVLEMLEISFFETDSSYIREKNEPPACRTGYRIKRICLCQRVRGADG